MEALGLILLLDKLLLLLDKLRILFKIVSEMKSSINKFDYPTASSQTYKMYRASPAKEQE